ncbi:hypothetical protein GQ457_06G009530 [Hibiscus cannabinus]
MRNSECPMVRVYSALGSMEKEFFSHGGAGWFWLLVVLVSKLGAMRVVGNLESGSVVWRDGFWFAEGVAWVHSSWVIWVLWGWWRLKVDDGRLEMGLSKVVELEMMMSAPFSVRW